MDAEEVGGGYAILGCFSGAPPSVETGDDADMESDSDAVGVADGNSAPGGGGPTWPRDDSRRPKPKR